VSNLFVIPGALLSLSLGILTLALSPVAPLATIAGFVLNGVLKGLNYLVFTVERLPYSLIDNIHITTFQSWMLLGMVIAVALLFEYRKYRYVLFLVGCCVCFGAVQWWHYLENSNHRKLVIYQVSGHSAMEWLDRGRSYFFADSVLLGDTERVRFHIRPNRLIHGVNRVLIKPESFVMDYAGSRLYTWHNVTLLNITGPDFSVPDGLKVDYLVVSNNAVDRLKKISAVRFISLILDGSNPDFTARKLLKEAEEAGMSAYSTAFNGAFVAKLQQHEPY
jgi:competence protein ComEC